MNYRVNEDKWPVEPLRPLFNAVLDLRLLLESENINEPVTLEEVKTWLKIDGTFNDSLIEDMLIPMSRAQLEKELNVSLISRNVTADIRYEVGDSGFILPMGPATGNIAATDINGDEIDEANYEIRAMGKDLALMTHYSFITLNYEAGYDPVPPDIKLKLLEKIAYKFRNKGDQ